VKVVVREQFICFAGAGGGRGNKNFIFLQNKFEIEA